MKKLLFIMLLTFTTMTYADEGRYTMLTHDLGVWVLDTETGKVKVCRFVPVTGEGESVTACTEWSGEYRLSYPATE